jgi:hypothetical protein
MASIALSVIRCIDYLGYGTLFTRAMFRPKKKLEVFLDFFSRQKSPRCSPGGGVLGISLTFPPFMHGVKT